MGVGALLGSVMSTSAIQGAPMACDVVGVRLHLREVRVVAVVSDTPGVLVVGVESTLVRPRCPRCGFCRARVHDRRKRREQ